MSEAHLAPNLAWPLASPSLDEAIEFIRRSLGDVTHVSGPNEIFAQYTDVPDVRATVSFSTDSTRHPNVVLKVNRFPFLSATASAHACVASSAPDSVPEVLGSECSDVGSMILLKAFEGKVVGENSTVPSLLATAKTLAQIQIRCTESCLKVSGLQIVQTADLKAIFAECLANIEANLAAWIDEDGAIAEAMGFSGREVLDRLSPLVPRIETWIEAVEAVGVELSIDHGDCHAGNAVQLEDGRILIFDWENACQSHPFFSAEKLMTSAWGLDVGKAGGPWGYRRDTPTQRTIAEAYLASFNLPTDAAERAFNAAMCLATIKEMRHEMEWARVCGWKDLNPEWTAQLVNRLFEHAAYA